MLQRRAEATGVIREVSYTLHRITAGAHGEGKAGKDNARLKQFCYHDVGQARRSSTAQVAVAAKARLTNRHQHAIRMDLQRRAVCV